MRIVYAIAIVLAGLGTAQAESVTRYSILVMGKASGAQITSSSEDGTVSVDFSYRDNGRGPDLKEKFTLGADGTVLRYEVKGTSTFGATIEETFSITEGKAEWKSLADRGSAKLSGAAAYVPIECSTEILARVVRAVALQREKKLAALPGGVLVVEKLLDERIEVGKKTREVSLYSLKGLYEEPYLVWLTKEPELRLFAAIVPGWTHLIEAGWESAGGNLETRQIDACDSLLSKLATKLIHRYPEPIAICNVRVFDSENAALGPPKDVYINRGRIAAIYDAGSPNQSAATIIDGQGRVLIPGLFDMHGHLNKWDSLQHLAGGVTSVRDMGNDNKFLNGLIDRIAKEATIGPRIIPAGFIEGSSNFSAKSGFVVSDMNGVKQAIDWYAQRGYPQIKIYNSFNREWMPEAVKYAHERGLRVSGHVPAFARAEDVVRAGFDEIQHINQVMLNFFVTPTDDTRTLARFDLVAQNAHRLDLKGKPVRDFTTLLKSKGTVIDPTLATFEGMFVQKQGEMDPSYASIASNLPLGTQRLLRTNSMKIPADSIETYRESYAKMVAYVGVMHREGIPLVAGTDAMAGFTLHRELELYVKAGIPAAEVLRIATWNGAKYTRTLDRTGSISPGKLADVVLIETDPTKNVSAIRQINFVMKEGVLYYPSEIHEATGIKPFVKPIKPVAAKK
jgi:hypothetical protein